MRLSPSSALLLALSFQKTPITAFVPLVPTQSASQASSIGRSQASSIGRSQASASKCRSDTTSLFLKDEWFAPDESENEGMVTREMLFRDMLEDPVVKKKKKGKSGNNYKTFDNRDHLPFMVKKMTPDPYTHPEKKAAKAKKAKIPRTDLDMQLTPSKLYESGKDGDSSTLLGEFKLDKSTTSGDTIIIGDHEFEVQQARCQYKYVGGKRFMMVRKVLEVKEVTRVKQEEFLKEQFQRSDAPDDTPPPLI